MRISEYQSARQGFLTGIFLILVLVSWARSQSTELQQFNDYRYQVNRTAMLTLGSWAVGNIVLNSILYGRGTGSTRYFYQMNVAWNLVNLGIAGFGYYAAMHPDTTLTLSQSLKEQANIEKILLFNAGLDVAYIMTGFYLKERSRNQEKYTDRFKGYGNSLILQGAFLFVFDLVVYYFQVKNHLVMESLLSNIYFSPSQIGIRIHF